MSKRGFVLASAAAACFAAGVVAGSANAEHHENEGKVKCEGANGCQGKAECKTAHNECSGLNSCKGKGWVYLSPEECEKAKAEDS